MFDVVAARRAETRRHAERFWAAVQDPDSVVGGIVARRSEERRVQAVGVLEARLRLLVREGPGALGFVEGALREFVARGELEGWFEPRV